MGKGTDMARESAPEHAAMMDNFKEQLLIVALKRLKANGISLVFPVAEVDDTGQDLLAFSIRDRAFHFDLQRKS